MKKRLNTESVTNELRGGSAFFPNHKKSAPLSDSHESEKIPTSREIGKEESREVGKEDSRKVGEEGSREIGVTPVAAHELFDINGKPYRKDSFLFTDEEFEALEDLKTDLRRKYDLKATKNDIARSAMQNLFRNFYQHKGESFIVKNLKKRKSR